MTSKCSTCFQHLSETSLEHLLHPQECSNVLTDRGIRQNVSGSNEWWLLGSWYYWHGYGFTRYLNPAHLASWSEFLVVYILQAVWFWFLYTWVGKYWLRVLMYVPFKKIYDFTTFFARLKKWTAHLHNDSRMDCCWKTNLTSQRTKKSILWKNAAEKKL